jgi:hypothetical protein
MGKGEQSLTTVMEHHGHEEFTQMSPPHERRMSLRLKWVKGKEKIYPKLVLPEMGTKTAGKPRHTNGG